MVWIWATSSETVAVVVATAPAWAYEARMCQNVFGFTANGLEGRPVALSRYRGKVMLIVPPASAG